MVKLSVTEETRELFRRELDQNGWSMARFSLWSRIPRSWLIAFRDGKIEKPSADRIEKLQQFLKTI